MFSQAKENLVTKLTPKRGLFDYQMSKQPLKNVVSMLIKDKDITSYQLIKQDGVLVNLSLLWLVNLEFFVFTFRKKMGRSGDWKRNILFGWP